VSAFVSDIDALDHPVLFTLPDGVGVRAEDVRLAWAAAVAHCDLLSIHAFNSRETP